MLKKNNKFLIINFQRTGDIIQSFHFIFAIKKKYPECKIYYLTNSIHKNSLTLIENYIETVYDLDYSFIYNRISSDISELFKYLKNFFSKVNSDNFDHLINLNFSFLGAIITTILNAQTKTGAELLNSHLINIKNKFFKELFLNLENKDFKTNIIENYLKGCELSYAKPIFPPINQEENSVNIILHPGASRNEKEWGIKNFTKLSLLISEYFKNNNISFFITGGKKETDKNILLEKNLLKANINAQNLTGITSIIDILNIIRKSSLLISGDTSIAHISSFTTIKSITIYLGNANHYHTYPYAPNKFVLFPTTDCYPCPANFDCKDKKCKKDITPEMVFNIIANKPLTPNVKKTYLDKDGFVKLY